MATSFVGPARPAWNRILFFLKYLGDIGTEGYSEETRRRLRLTNFGVYLIALTSINYAFLYLSFDPARYREIIIGNILLTGLAVWVPFSHRIHDHAGVISIAVVEYTAMFWLISQIGRDAGIQINYIIGAAVPFLLCDTRRVLLLLLLVVGALALHISAWFLFPEGALPSDARLNAMIYINSAITTFGIIAFAVWYAFRQVTIAKAETDALLRNILPEKVVDRLMAAPGHVIADNCDEASVLFADLVSFTPTARELGAQRVVALLNRIFSHFDEIADDLGVEKIKTIGDAYMVVAGLPEPQSDHVQRLAEMALRMHRVIDEIAESEGVPIRMRAGLEAGPVMAGVIGRRKFIYDVWGDAVNVASRLQSSGEPGKTQISASLCARLGDAFQIAPRGTIDIRGLGPRETCFLIGRKEAVA